MFGPHHIVIKRKRGDRRRASAINLFVCRHLLATTDTPDIALDRLRPLIHRHNERVGIRPGFGGYHETISRYFVWAMAHANPPTIAALLMERSLRRDAPRRHWTTESLHTEAARTTWVDPDLAPLPWVPVPCTCS